MKLARRGERLPPAMHAATYLARQLGSLPRAAVDVVAASAAPEAIARTAAPYVVIADGDRVVGVIARAELAKLDHVVLAPEAALATSLIEARRADAAVVVVAHDGEVLGVVTRAQLADAVADELAALVD
jgi:hypothetical protein